MLRDGASSTVAKPTEVKSTGAESIEASSTVTKSTGAESTEAESTGTKATGAKKNAPAVVAAITGGPFVHGAPSAHTALPSQTPTAAKPIRRARHLSKQRMTHFYSHSFGSSCKKHGPRPKRKTP